MKSKPKTNKTRIDAAFLQEALLERKSSDDPKALSVPQSGVGAIVVRNEQIISRSANVFPPALSLHRQALGISVDEDERYHLIEHAERAAIFKALTHGESLNGATMYCTRYPCSDCARAMVWAGIRRVVIGSGLRGEGRWLEAQRAARAIFKQAGITVRVMLKT